MMADEIIEDLWNIKDAMAKEFGCDVRALVAHLRGRRVEEEARGIELGSVKQVSKQKDERTTNP